MFGGTAGAYPREGAPLYGRLQASPTNIRLGWKGLQRTNTLAYYENPKIAAVKSFIVLAPRGQYYKTYRGKLECFKMPFTSTQA
jgi:hypothetical protein